MFLGLRTVIHPSSDLERDKAFWTETLGFAPYFDEPFYVGFNVGGYELGLDPNGASEGQEGPVHYWGVENCDAAFAELKGKGIPVRGEVQEVGGGIKVASFLDKAGFPFGIIENPHFGA